MNYPENPVKGAVIHGLEQAESLEGVSVLHAGTSVNAAGETVVAGGRVLAVVGLGADLHAARAKAYAGIAAISWDGAQHRTDIALKAANGQINLSEGTH